MSFERTAMLIGGDGLEILAKKRVAVFGVGGVGGHLCEALVRAGVGAVDMFDPDTVAESNLNRQLAALHSTVGMLKVEAMAARLRDINPECKIGAYPVFYLPENAGEYPLDAYHFVADAVDTVSAKIELVQRSKAAGVPIICAMGTGNKLHPECLELTDLAKTETCPLARVMRRELKKRGIVHLPVVASRELPIAPQGGPVKAGASFHKAVPGSISFVPPVAGLIMAGAIVRGLLGLDG